MPDIQYTRVGWQNAPDTSTPLSAANLNSMENGIVAAINAINALQTDVGDLESDTELLNNTVTVLNNRVDALSSHVGSVIFSTTLSTAADVIAIYGGTAWTQINSTILPGVDGIYAWERTE